MRRRDLSRTRRAITLVEGLVAAAVLGMLAGMTMQTFSVVRGEGGQIEELSSLHAAAARIRNALIRDLGNALPLRHLEESARIRGRDLDRLELLGFRGYEGKTATPLHAERIVYRFVPPKKGKSEGSVLRNGRHLGGAAVGDLRLRWSRDEPTRLIVELRMDASEEDGPRRVVMLLDAPPGTDGGELWNFSLPHQPVETGTRATLGRDRDASSTAAPSRGPAGTSPPKPEIPAEGPVKIDPPPPPEPPPAPPEIGGPGVPAEERPGPHLPPPERSEAAARAFQDEFGVEVFGAGASNEALEIIAKELRRYRRDDHLNLLSSIEVIPDSNAGWVGLWRGRSARQGPVRHDRTAEIVIAVDSSPRWGDQWLEYILHHEMGHHVYELSRGVDYGRPMAKELGRDADAFPTPYARTSSAELLAENHAMMMTGPADSNWRVQQLGWPILSPWDPSAEAVTRFEREFETSARLPPEP